MGDSLFEKDESLIQGQMFVRLINLSLICSIYAMNSVFKREFYCKHLNSSPILFSCMYFIYV